MTMETVMPDIAVPDACLELSYEDVEIVKGLQDPHLYHHLKARLYHQSHQHISVHYSKVG
jgi:hypothetical protein